MICDKIEQESMRNIAISIILFAVSAAIFSFQSGIIGLEFKGDENFYFLSSRQMLESGDWITPYYFERPRFEKPPLYYWVTAASFRLLGVNWWAARLPSAVSMAFIVMLTYLFGLRFFNRNTGILSSVIVMSTMATFRYARLVLPEALFVLLLSAALYLFVFRKSYITAYILISLSILIKGPVGFILPLFILAAYGYSLDEKKFFSTIKFRQGLLITLAVSLPWFVIMAKVHGKPYIDHIFLRETIQRIGGFEDWAKALLYFVPVIFIFYLPWSFYLVPSIRDTALSIKEKGPSRNGNVFSFVWFFAIFIFFTFLGEKHRHYMLALCIPFGLMLGHYFHSVLSTKKGLRAAFIFIALLLSFFVFESAKMAIAREIGGVGSLFGGKPFNIESDDKVGIGSHAIVPQEVEIYVNHPVERAYFKWPSKKESDYATTWHLNNYLLREGTNGFLLIKKSDYLKYIKPQTKNRLTILAKGYMYVKETKLAGIFRVARNMNRKAFLDLFREEVYFVTNKKGVK